MHINVDNRLYNVHQDTDTGKLTVQYENTLTDQIYTLTAYNTVSLRGSLMTESIRARGNIKPVEESPPIPAQTEIIWGGTPGPFSTDIGMKSFNGERWGVSIRSPHRKSAVFEVLSDHNSFLTDDAITLLEAEMNMRACEEIPNMVILLRELEEFNFGDGSALKMKAFIDRAKTIIDKIGRKSF